MIMKKLSCRKTELVKYDTDDKKTAQQYFNRGNEKFIIKDYNGAITCYTLTIEIDPKNTMAYYYRGCAKILLQDSKGAMTDLTKAVEIPLLSNTFYCGDAANHIH